MFVDADFFNDNVSGICRQDSNSIAISSSQLTAVEINKFIEISSKRAIGERGEVRPFL